MESRRQLIITNSLAICTDTHSHISTLHLDGLAHYDGLAKGRKRPMSDKHDILLEIDSHPSEIPLDVELMHDRVLPPGACDQLDGQREILLDSPKPMATLTAHN